MQDTYTKKIRKPPKITHNKSSISYTGPQIAQIYGFPAPSSNNSTTVGVLSFGGGLYGTLDSNGFLTDGDVQSTWTKQGINSSDFPKVIIKLIGSATNDVNDIESTIENTMDVSVIGACCPNPNLTIILFIFPNTSLWSYAFSTLLSGATIGGTLYKPTIISVSWGSSENEIIQNNSFGTFVNVNNTLANANLNGVNICCATGDYGSTNDTSTTALDLVFPASCPTVTAVGGTTLNCTSYIYSNPSTTETVWNNGIINGKLIATGGGISKYFDKPVYQNNISGIKRLIPDVALLGDPDTGFSFDVNGSTIIVGGTSLSAPVFAAYLACIGTLKFFVNPILYNNTSAFHDITSRNNYSPNQTNNALKYYSANSGYDCCSGLGSINGALLTPLIKNFLLTPILTITTNPINKSITDSPFDINPHITTNSTRNFTFSSSNTLVATIDASGIVTIINSGSTTITVNLVETDRYSSATADVVINILSGTKTTPTLNIINPINKITTDTSPFDINPYITTNSTRNFTFSSLNTSVATIDTNGIVTIIGSGSTTITIILAENATYEPASTTTIINIIKAIPSLNVINQINKNTTDISFDINQYITTNSSRNFTFSSSNNSVATIEPNSGIVTIIGGGTTIITVNLLENALYTSMTASIILNINILCKSLKIGGIKNNIYIKNKIIKKQLKAFIVPINVTNKFVKWKSNNPNIASINSKGILIIKKIGKIIITCLTTDGSNISAKFKLNILKK